MAWFRNSEKQASMRRNLTDHLDLGASAELPEAHDPRFARTLIYVLMSALVSLIAWSAITPVVEIATGNGVIQTQSAVERVEHIDGGRVSQIEVVAGQRVEEGTRLIAFETQTVERELEKLNAAQAALVAEQARLRFVLNGSRVSDAAPDLTSQDPVELLFWTEQSFLDAQMDVLDAERAALQEALSMQAVQEENLSREATLLRDQLARSERAIANGIISRNEADRLEREVLQMERSLLSLQANTANQRNELRRVTLRQNELVTQRQRDAAQRLADVESRITSNALSMDELRDRIARADVRATVSGTVMALSVSNPNEVVGPGELIAEIVPDDSLIEAEVEISADKIGSVAVGTEARVKVLTYDFTRFGQLIGTVSEISPSSFVNEAGATVYRVTIVFPPEQADFRLGRDVLAPGLTVTADVLSDSKMILTYLLKPLRLLRDRAFTEA